MNYDSVIIGGGLSGLAAGIRLAHYGKRVCIFERHTRYGGLNSFYTRGAYQLETGLHAMTNFATKGSSNSLPLMKLLRQLRIPYDTLKLREQNFSLIDFPDKTLTFTNNFSDFKSSIADNFPKEIDSFIELDAMIVEYNELNLAEGYCSARKVLSEYITSPLLTDMLFCPLMYYGSAVEDDIDFSQFVIMYKSIFHQGFCRPGGSGIRFLLSILEKRFTESGGELRLGCGVDKIESHNGKVVSVVTTDGATVECEKVLSSAGNIETLALCSDKAEDFDTLPRGELSYLETLAIVKEKFLDTAGRDETIIFFNDKDSFDYKKPSEPVDTHSGVICFPRNFGFAESDILPEPAIRVTALANHNLWVDHRDSRYKALKEENASVMLKKAEEITGIANIEANAVYIDTMTPRTIERYTGHIHGSIYGSPHKVKDGKTHLDNLFICGTDQGFLGITGAMLSGISMANLHMLI